MRVNELAQELKTTSTILIDLLGSDEVQSPLNGLTDEQVEGLRKDVAAKREAGELPELGSEDTETNIDELMKELADTKELLKIQEDLNDKQAEVIADLKEEIELISGGAVAQPADKPDQKKINAECEKLTKGMSADKITEIKTNLECMGTKSKHWDKYSILLKQK